MEVSTGFSMSKLILLMAAVDVCFSDKLQTGISLKRLEEVEREKPFYKSFPGLLSKIWGPATVSEVIRD